MSVHVLYSKQIVTCGFCHKFDTVLPHCCQNCPYLAPCVRDLQANRRLIDRARCGRETGLPLLVCNRTGIAGFGDLQSTL